MTREYIQHLVIPTVYSLLPGAMNSDNATAMLLAIGLQESHLEKRRQYPAGPARGFWQFERIAVSQVFIHPSTMIEAQQVCATLRYPPSVNPVYDALADNDVLACSFARLLLWQHPDALPRSFERDKGWAQYLDRWKPGLPRKDDWPDNFVAAHAAVRQT